jgi:hypothetical protein
MNRISRFSVAIVFALLLAAMLSSVVSAHYCTNQNKKDGAGSIGTVNIATGEVDIEKTNGGFVTITDGDWSYDVFIHAQEKHDYALPEGALNAGPGDDQCDGKGVDNALVCLGIEE